MNKICINLHHVKGKQNASVPSGMLECGKNTRKDSCLCNLYILSHCSPLWKI